MATVSHLGFSLQSHILRNHWADLNEMNETWPLCLPQCASTKENVVCWQIWPLGSQLGLSKISHWQACYHIFSKKPLCRFEWNLIRMFPTMSSCASRKKNSSPLTNMTAIGHLGFFLLLHPLRNHCSDLNEAWLLCSPQGLVLQAPENSGPQTNLAIYITGSQLGLSEISYWQAC